MFAASEICSITQCNLLVVIRPNILSPYCGNKPNRRYLLCAEYKRLACKARATIADGGGPNDLVVTSFHNHPPTPEASMKIEFVSLIKQCIIQQGSQTSLKGIYSGVEELYPEIAQFYSYGKLAPSMRRWRQLAKKGKLK